MTTSSLTNVSIVTTSKISWLKVNFSNRQQAFQLLLLLINGIRYTLKCTLKSTQELQAVIFWRVGLKMIVTDRILSNSENYNMLL